MSREHWALLAIFIGAVGVQISTLAHWQEGMTPQFIGTSLVQLGIVLRGFFTDKPNA